MTRRLSFPAALRKHQERLDWSNAQMAELLEVGVSTYGAWLRGDPKRIPHVLTQEGALARLERAKSAA